MVISVLIGSDKLCNAIEKHEVDVILELLEELNAFPNECILSEENYADLNEMLYKGHRDEECMRLSRKMERLMSVDEVRYHEEKRQILELCEEESCSFEEILVNSGRFVFGEYKLYLGQDLSLRSIERWEDLYLALILFGNAINNEKEFADYIRKVYKTLLFDGQIEGTLRKLEAGLAERRKEILFHLYCIENEIPQIIQKCGLMDNRTIGAQMSIPCSPERNRDTVKNNLTKKADNGNIVCELHTKMKKIGSRKPDRIYFCASVPKGILLERKNIQERIFVFKITQHV